MHKPLCIIPIKTTHTYFSIMTLSRPFPVFPTIFDNLNLIYPRIQHPGWNQLATIWKNYMIEIMYEDVDIDSKIADMAEEIDEVLEDAVG